MVEMVGLPLSPALSDSVAGSGCDLMGGDNDQVWEARVGLFLVCGAAWHSSCLCKNSCVSAWAQSCSPLMASGDHPVGLVLGLGPREAETQSRA